jgi:hypothetical protein
MPNVPAEPDWALLRQMKPSLSTEHIESIAKLSEIYLQPEATEFSEDDLISNLQALWKLSKQQNAKINKKDAKLIEKISNTANLFFRSNNAHHRITMNKGESQPKTRISMYAAIQEGTTIMKDGAKKARNFFKPEYREIVRKIGLKANWRNLQILCDFDKELKAAGAKEGEEYSLDKMLAFGIYNHHIKDASELQFLCGILVKLRRESGFHNQKAIIEALAGDPWLLTVNETSKLLAKNSVSEKEFVDSVVNSQKQKIRYPFDEVQNSILKIIDAADGNKYCLESAFSLLELGEKYASGLSADFWPNFIRSGLEKISQKRLLRMGKDGTFSEKFFTVLGCQPFYLSDAAIELALADAGKSEQFYEDKIIKGAHSFMVIDGKREYSYHFCLADIKKSRFVLDVVAPLWVVADGFERKALLKKGFLGESADSDVIDKLANALKVDEKLWLDLSHQYCKYVGSRLWFSGDHNHYPLNKKILDAFEANPRFRILFPTGDNRSLKKFWLAAFGTGEDDGRAEHLRRNLETILELEKERPGIFRKLYETQGITHYERHSEKFWLTQYDKIGKRTVKPILAIIEADKDHNAAFRAFGGETEHLEKDFDVRIFGALKKREAAKALLLTHSRYGKISVLILAGHGTRGGVILGQDTIIASDITNNKVSRLFSKKPSVIFISCSTGAPGAIVWKISEKYTNVHFHAPKEPASYEKIIYLGEKDGRHIFDVRWHKSEIKAEYVGGKLVEA